MKHFLKDISATAFNQKYPLGSRFAYFPVIGIPDYVEVVTRSQAWTDRDAILGQHNVVVSVKGLAGALSIKRMKPMTAVTCQLNAKTRDSQPSVKNQTED
ncbi:hypothetical protein ABQG65_08695 [Yersinia alsatica]|uniref:hypothetical protein n=1 Tax=Yersinia alsatica TaxID=2890317 RepID=UPI0032EBEF77